MAGESLLIGGSRSAVWTAMRTLVAAIGVAATTTPAFAQTKDVEPRYVTVTADNTSLRCGGGDVWYVVGQAKAGDVLVVDGESYDWLRVSYPANIPALVVATEARAVPAKGGVELTQPSKLFAFSPNAAAQNPAAAVRDSWKSLLRDPLPAGTVLRLTQALNDTSGKTVGYLVEAPDTARAYVLAQAVRAATDAEKQAALRARSPQPQAATPAAAEPAPARASTPVTTAPSGSGEATTRPTTTPTADAGAPTGGTTTGAEQPAQAAAPTLSPDAPATTTMTGQPTETAKSAPPQDPVLRRIATFEDLDKAYKKVIAEPIGQAELDPLIAEYKRLLGSLGDAHEDNALRPAVTARMNLLEIRAQLQEDMQKLAAAEARARGASEDVTRLVQTYNAGRPYTAVGRLMASLIYDGERLPLMFRLQSVEGGESVRTLAYILPAPDVDLKGKLGSIVGVEGDGRQDPALRLDLIIPRRVDVLTSADRSVPAPPTTTTSAEPAGDAKP